jgi:hypothetical protein
MKCDDDLSRSMIFDKRLVSTLSNAHYVAECNDIGAWWSQFEDGQTCWIQQVILVMDTALIGNHGVSECIPNCTLW